MLSDNGVIQYNTQRERERETDRQRERESYDLTVNVYKMLSCYLFKICLLQNSMYAERTCILGL